MTDNRNTTTPDPASPRDTAASHEQQQQPGCVDRAPVCDDDAQRMDRSSDDDGWLILWTARQDDAKRKEQQ
jgi:hypothetical protein